MAASFPTTKDWNVHKDRNQGKPLYSLSLSLPHSDILVCGSSLLAPLLVSLLCHYPAASICKKGLILPVLLITTLFNCRFDWLEMALRLGQMLGGHVKLITDESLESILDHQHTINFRKCRDARRQKKKSRENSRLSLFKQKIILTTWSH